MDRHPSRCRVGGIKIINRMTGCLVPGVPSFSISVVSLCLWSCEGWWTIWQLIRKTTWYLCPVRLSISWSSDVCCRIFVLYVQTDKALLLSIHFRFWKVNLLFKFSKYVSFSSRLKSDQRSSWGEPIQPSFCSTRDECHFAQWLRRKPDFYFVKVTKQVEHEPEKSG